ncbi:hypothetical protein CR513_55756, partial [Mucuna pruriens]
MNFNQLFAIKIEGSKYASSRKNVKKGVMHSGIEHLQRQIIRTKVPLLNISNYQIHLTPPHGYEIYF